MTTHVSGNNSSNTTPVAPRAKVYRFVFLALAVLILICWFRFHYQPLKQKEADDEKVAETKATTNRLAAEEAMQYAVAHPQPISQCITPCSMYLGWGQNAIWAPGESMKVKYAGGDWFTYGEKDGVKQSPAAFKPGETYFESPKGLSVLVQIYNH